MVKNSKRNLKPMTYAFIKNYFKKHGYMPTFAEIGNSVGILSSSTVQRILLNLEEDGMIKLGRNSKGKMSPRAIVLRGMRIKFPELEKIDWVKEEYKNV